MRSVIPPAPVSSEFEKYISQKVSLANGLPEINIDLYKIEVEGVTIPIRLSYHPSGIKYFQHSGEVGVGWVLNPGYRISRTIYGLPDERYRMPSMNEINTNAFGIKTKLERDRYLSNFCVSTQGERFLDGPHDFNDGQYDIFSYNLDNENGNFLITDRDQKQVSFLTTSNKKKIAYTTHSRLGINTFDLTDLRGVRYIFGRDELNNDTICELTNGNREKNTTAWPVSKIITPLNQELLFRYNKYELNKNSIPAHSLEARYGGDYYGGHLEGQTYLADILSEGYGTSIQSYYEVYYSSEIVTPKEKIVFDREQYTGVIKMLTVRDLDNNIVRRVKFYYNTYSNNQPFTFLDSIRIYDRNDVNYQLYRFDYKDKNTACTNYDPWGYCINTEGQNTLQFLKLVWSGNVGNTDNFSSSLPSRFTNLEYGVHKEYATPDIFTLSKITYPTGGYTTYMYENNRYNCKPEWSAEHGPGLRVKVISSYNNWGGLELQKKYEYGEGGLGFGIRGCMPDWGNDILDRIELWEPPQSTKLIAARKVLYSSLPNPEVSDSYTAGNWGWYDEVAETDLSGGIVKRKTVSKYTKDYLDLSSFPTNGSVQYRSPLLRTYDYANATLLTDKIYYDMPYNQPERIVRKEHYEYAYTLPKDMYTGLKVVPFVKRARGQVFSPLIYDYYNGTNIESVFNYHYYYIYAGYKQISKQTETTYAPDGTSLTTTRETGYNDLGLNAWEKYYTSKGELTETVNSYVYDYRLATGTDPLSAGVKKMAAMNILSAPVEKSVYRLQGTNRELASSLLTYYMADKPLTAKASQIEASVLPTDFKRVTMNAGVLTADSRYQPAVLFDSYDAKGNLLQQRMQNNTPVSYIWDYSNSLPVAEVKNAERKDIAYTSFEADGKGNWQLAATQRITNDAVTGSKSYALQNGAVTASGLTATQQYIVSYWAKTGAAVTVSGTTKSMSGATENGWTYKEHEVTGVSVIQVSGTGNIDELRLYPADAQVNTYTHQPLVGATSHTNENNKITYYSYDAFGRLVAVRDARRNIRQQMGYVYQQNELSTPYKNVLKQKTVNRNNCAPGTTGSQVTYVVPAGKYGSMLSQADADAKAQADVDANTQTYANENGTCPAGYWNATLSLPYKKTTCPAGAEPEIIIYSVSAGKYQSFISQADADAKAKQEADTKGPIRANEAGACFYTNYPMGQVFTKACPAGQTGSNVSYSVPAGKYKSRVSQADANAMAQAEIDSKGQAFANENGVCGTPNFYVTVRRGPVPPFEVRIMKVSNNDIVDRKEFQGDEPGRPAYATMLPAGENLYFRVTCSGSMIVAINGQQQTINGGADFNISGSPCVVEMMKID
ncbi:RHS repeat protein [Chitinophaga sp. Mgbs1]|uniref:RHS repeat protein n=1 Tax=Chitinophaga solisilvae TaxID=1233460 RepID=A0A9Q5CUY3_9BACT|nr:RHS repeat protein [Chitinophaga solisilvae]